MEIREIVTVLFLVLNSLRDWKKKEISLFLTGVYGAVGVLFSMCSGREIKDWMVPIGISLIFLSVSILTGGEIGMGDGLAFLALAAMLTTGVFVKTVCIGLFLAAGYAGILLVLCKKGRKTEIPLLPFLLAGYLGGILL